MRCTISNILDKAPSLSSRSSQLRQWGEELLDKSTHGEAGLAAFDRFSENLIHYNMRERISHVTKGLKLNSSKRTNLVRFPSNRIEPFWPNAFLEGEVRHHRNRGWSSLSMTKFVRCLCQSTLFHNLLTTLIPTGTASTPVELTSDELNAMRYACGYVPCSLLKKYETNVGRYIHN